MASTRSGKPRDAANSVNTYVIVIKAFRFKMPQECDSKWISVKAKLWNFHNQTGIACCPKMAAVQEGILNLERLLQTEFLMV